MLPVIALTFLACISAKHQEQASSRVGLGAAYLNEGNTPGAVVVLQEAVDLDRRNWAAWNKLALAYMSAGSMEKAGPAFEKAVALEPANGEVQNNYGIYLMRAGDFDAAIDAFRIASADLTYRKPALVLTNLGYAYLLSDRLTEAQGALDQAIRRAPNLCHARYNRGQVFAALGQPVRALQDFEVVIRLCGDEASGAYMHAGQILLASGERPAACDYLSTVIAQASGSELHDQAVDLSARECRR